MSGIVYTTYVFIAGLKHSFMRRLITPFLQGFSFCSSKISSLCPWWKQVRPIYHILRSMSMY